MRPHAALHAFWREIAYETRRHAGDERLPLALRTRLRQATHRALERSARFAPPVEPMPRRAVRAAPRAVTAAPGAEGAGGAPLVIVAVRRGSDACAPAMAYLRAEGYHVVESPAPDGAPPATARFVVTDSLEAQRAASAAGIPALAVNLDDAFSGYPVHADGLYALRHAIDLDTGRRVPLAERLTDAYYRHLRNIGYRNLSGGEMLDAVREMHEGLRHGWRESAGQRRFREQVVDAGRALAARVPAVAAVGPDDGFIGDGRLVRFQADEAP